MPVTRRALALALALALAACAAAALAPLARPGLPPWMEGVAAQADFGPAGYLMYVVVGNGTWAGARLQQGVAYSEYSQGLSWECAGKGAYQVLVDVTTLGPEGVTEQEVCYLFVVDFAGANSTFRIDYDPAECVGALRADKPWTNIVWTFESGQVVSPFDAQDECA